MHPLSSIPVFPTNVAVHNTPADRVNTEDGLLQPINIHKFVLRHGKLLYTFRHSRKRRFTPEAFPRPSWTVACRNISHKAVSIHLNDHLERTFMILQIGEISQTMHHNAVHFFVTLAIGCTCAASVVPRVAQGANASPPANLSEAVAISRTLSQAPATGGQAILAAKADSLAMASAEMLIPCLRSLSGATAPGANWLRSSLERIVERCGDTIPEKDLETFVRDTTQDPRARRLAFEWLHDRNPSLCNSLLDGMIEDPSLELRRDALNKFLATKEDTTDETLQKTIVRKGLMVARDRDQIDRCVTWLKEHGEQVDVAAVYGFVRAWDLSKTYDNKDGVGFSTIYPPETNNPPTPLTEGWKRIHSTDDYGTIDLNREIETQKGVTAYAVASIEFPQAVTAEVRIGSPCAVQVWVNGIRVMSHEIYHASEAIDQYIASATFQPGTNSIVVKCCQNEQTEPWAADWKFQLRVCDSLGTPLGVQRLPDTP